MTPDVLTLKELAAVLRIGVRTIERGLQRRTFPIVPILSGVSARRLFARADVDRYLSDPAARVPTRRARDRRADAHGRTARTVATVPPAVPTGTGGDW